MVAGCGFRHFMQMGVALPCFYRHFGSCFNIFAFTINNMINIKIYKSYGYNCNNNDDLSFRYFYYLQDSFYSSVRIPSQQVEKHVFGRQCQIHRLPHRVYNSGIICMVQMLRLWMCTSNRMVNLYLRPHRGLCLVTKETIGIERLLISTFLMLVLGQVYSYCFSQIP